MFQLHRAIIRSLPKNRSISDSFVQLGSQTFTMLNYCCLQCTVRLKLLELKWISVCCNKIKYYVITKYHTYINTVRSVGDIMTYYTTERIFSRQTFLENLAENWAPCSYIETCSQNWKKKRLLAASCMSVCPHGTIRLPLDGLSSNLIFQYFSKICRENSRFIKIGPDYRIFYITTNILFLSHLDHFFSKGEIFREKLVEKIKTNILHSIIFLGGGGGGNNRTVYEIIWENIVGRGRPQLATRRMRTACWITKAIHTLSDYATLTALPLQQWLQVRVSMVYIIRTMPASFSIPINCRICVTG